MLPLAALVASLISLHLAGVAPAMAQTPPAPLRHFQCYDVRGAAAVRVPGVALTDRFGASTVDVRAIDRICNPANKNSEDPSASSDPEHLVAYAIRTQTTTAVAIPDQVVVNQFGTVTVNIGRPQTLLVPSAKSRGSDPAELVDPRTDHFTCYDVTSVRTPVDGVVMTDQFGTITVDVRSLRWLCAPTNKNGEGVNDPTAHLACYDVRLASEAFTPAGRVFVANQFGHETLQARRPGEICVPSLATAIAPTTTPDVTATAPPSTPTPVTSATSVQTAIVTETPTPTATPTDVPVPSATATATPECGNGVVEAGEQCDPPGTPTCANAGNGLEICSISCTCSCPGAIELEPIATDAATELDHGWTGIAHDLDIVSDGTVTVEVTDCAGATRPCGVCNVSGPIPNTQADNGQIANRRCRLAPRTQCTSDADCTGVGPCVFFAGAPVPSSAGGVFTCTLTQIASIMGTVNVESGDVVTVWSGTEIIGNGDSSPEGPCPRCIGDLSPNDGVRDGTCSRPTFPPVFCDANAESPVAGSGPTSLDCPPQVAANATLGQVAFTARISSSTQTHTLTAASPTCTAENFTSLKCACDTCNNAAATACMSNADCPDNPAGTPGICGGLRCLSGTNPGTPCTTNTQCLSGGFCTRRGAATQPNTCADGQCVAGGDADDGMCATGPDDRRCAIDPRFPCINNADCPAGDFCPATAKRRECYFDQDENGTTTRITAATGAADPPVDDVATPTLTSLYCLGPADAAAVNVVQGRPGLGRVRAVTEMRYVP